MNYNIFDPSGNITALIPVSDMSACDRRLADKIMELEPEVEQAGFIMADDEADIRLQMAGGEFCGNASLCAAASYAINKELPKGSSMRVRIKVSGCMKILNADITAEGDCFSGVIEMPEINEIRTVTFAGGEQADVVFMPGMAHAVVNESFGMDRAEKCIKSWCDFLGTDALGIMLADDKFTSITPLVYVKTAGTLFHEHSCASGSAACAAYLAVRENKHVNCELTEPGGVIGVEAEPYGSIKLKNTIKKTR